MPPLFFEDEMRTKLTPYRTKRAEYEFTSEMLDLMERRVGPFMDKLGLQTRPLSHLMQEAYLQGIKDACDALALKEELDATQ